MSALLGPVTPTQESDLAVYDRDGSRHNICQVSETEIITLCGPEARL